MVPDRVVSFHPIFFSVYMRDISCAINRSVIGCHVGGNPCKILFYADDMVILSPSWKDMQLLLDLAPQIVNDIDRSLMQVNLYP